MFDLIEKEFLDTENKAKEFIFLRKEYFNRQKSVSDELVSLTTNTLLLEKVSSLFKHLLDTLLEEKKKEIEQLVTFGLKTVFVDQDLKFNMEIEHKYNTIHTSFKTEVVGVTNGDVLENFGGGIVNVESFLLRVVTLFQTKLHPFLILDENFQMLMGDDYLDNCSQLIKQMCEELGLTIFAITQKEQLINNADKAYRAGSDNNKFYLTEITKNGT